MVAFVQDRIARPRYPSGRRWYTKPSDYTRRTGKPPVQQTREENSASSIDCRYEYPETESPPRDYYQITLLVGLSVSTYYEPTMYYGPSSISGLRWSIVDSLSTAALSATC
jgi:hypothetical protein